MNPIQENFDDVGEAIRENRPLRTAQLFRIQVAVDNVDFQQVYISDPMPTGRQILTAIGLDDREEVTLYAILPNGDFEDIRLNETYDLRGREIERFIIFKTDREFKLKLDGRELKWGQPTIEAHSLYVLSGIGPDQAIFFEVRGGTDRLLEADEILDLTNSGVEHFITAKRPIRDYTIVVNSREETVTNPVVTFEQIVQLAFPNAPCESNTIYSMTYRNAASRPHAGELAEGGVVEVKHKGTIFNVTKTIQS
ncbi:multiubiquitin domain-containing protein [Acinetobacter baumannii]|uniref:multiubiquitin domain-containing protein n=1 Tax=Acinetobacter baumannii TaxID=470 RepID=UPI000BF2D190|nr:multiubiquitin domain-containing protein [Acinetobacter baumannii]EKT9379268.1 multiubiquitin domain-containing protein [Acinetobacter baumannii]EKU0758316.1 multiubiquitin domain-containing protein [Acinetobacter baumannii]EKV8392708.1 multiubiquitin domain-containing protein [Acinetobacter baumannii]EKW0728702.1 multiubiquitin domain-containing protein [Acinetobacter baumannii]EKW0737565.1 multiubiquitin domain-containing protein [Acinetobacter baumannii]